MVFITMIKHLNKFQNNFQLVRHTSTSLPKNEFIPSNFVNRNPRNLEKMRIGYKPDGYHVDNPGKCYWHRVDLEVTGRYVSASINHFRNGEVIRASTSEWCIKKFLYRPKDSSAYINLGRVLAQRCLQSGIIEVNCFIKPLKPDGRIALFLEALKEGGVCLIEPTQYKASYPWDQYRPEKPWEVTE